MCHLLLAYWASVKCLNFAALSCCVFISMYASAACLTALTVHLVPWSCSVHILSMLCVMRCIDAWIVLAAYIVLTVCFLAVHTKVTFDTFFVCLMLLVFTCLFHFVMFLYLLIVLYCTLFCCCTRYSLFSCVVIVLLCCHFGVWLVCLFWLVSL